MLFQGPLSPEHLEEWGRGYLVTQGYCSSDRPLRMSRQKENLYFEEIPPAPSEFPKKKPSSEPEDWSLSETMLFEGIQKVQEAELYRKTGAAHVGALFSKEGKLLVLREDPGRYHAADKALGWGLRERLDFRNTFFLFSGRMPESLIRKIALLEIPLVASVSAPTFEGVLLAEEKNITLIGFLRPPRMNLYVRGRISLEE